MSIVERSTLTAEQMQAILAQQPNLVREIDQFLYVWRDDRNRLYERLVMNHNRMTEREKNTYRLYLPLAFMPTGGGLYIPISLRGLCIEPWYPTQNFFAIYPKRKGIPLVLDPDDYLFTRNGAIFLADPEEFLRQRKDTLLFIKRADKVIEKINRLSMQLDNFSDDPEDDDEEEELFSATSGTAVMSNLASEP